MEIVAVIPARYGSSRLPGKPLCDLGGKPVIQHVYERTMSAGRISRVMVATDDERIAQAVRSFGGDAVMTSPDHPNGTCRVAEAIKGISCDGVVNVQGDEPFMDPALVDQVALCLFENPEIPMVSLRYPLAEEEIDNPNRVKVVVDQADRALYFSRSPIPYRRVPGATVYGHLGIYGYRTDFLDRYISLEPTPLSESESLEQLRAIEHGYDIMVPVARGRHAPGIDTDSDLLWARKKLEKEMS
jgi:3-deoxy-manno-octulosonate cytidylyltransferase (CMP-KDO synthetase)